ncbi:MAG TPA: hypothetical protein PLG15_03075 [Candidatus Gastranaerophilaceae bacterium]|nr:hypothetical protein [Candidatus Gastranaerophilaceae bacterium]HPT41347.1 hypothetical protein [Candidatus Gastranaerophilaceae bacterium]
MSYIGRVSFKIANYFSTITSKTPVTKRTFQAQRDTFCSTNSQIEDDFELKITDDPNLLEKKIKQKILSANINGETLTGWDAEIRSEATAAIYKKNFFDLLSQKAQTVKDEKIITHINQIFNEIFCKSKITSEEHIQNFWYFRDLLDAYNMSEGLYSKVGKTDEYYKIYTKNEDEDYQKCLINLIFSDKNLLYKILEENPNKNNSLAKWLVNFQNDSRFESLKYYIKNYSLSQKDMTNYMYEKYYLSQIPENTKKLCEKISAEFGIKMFLHNNYDKENLNIIYDELSNWKKASQGKALFPHVIDLSTIDPDYIKEKSPSAAYFSTAYKFICVNGNRPLNMQKGSLRHEMTHLNDLKPNDDSYFENLLENRNKFQQEFANAGIDQEYIDYAFKKDASEFKAVATEGDYSKYSDEFKDLLVNLGLPKWVFNMTPVGKMEK